MRKIIHQTDNDLLVEACGGLMTQLIDRNGRELVKEATSNSFSKSELDALRPPDSHFMAHAIAMGSTEAYGFNRNADGFSKVALQKYHPTFVTHGHLFREHRNRDPKTQGLGFLKAAKFNEPMERVEIILWADKEKCASEYEAAKSGKSLSFSMSCRVPYDRCHVCDHMAKRASEYCDHMTFSPGQYLPQFEKYAFVHNDHPTFFDLSFVGRPADRIAHFLEYRFGNDQMQKAASSDMVILGADWAEMDELTIPDVDDAIPLNGAQLSSLRKLAAAEEWLENNRERIAQEFPTESDALFAKMASSAMQSEDELSDADLKTLRALEPPTLFRHLAKRAAVFNFPTFVAYVTGKPMADVRAMPAVKAACCGGISSMMRGILNDVLGSGGSPIGDMFSACGREQADADAGGSTEIDRVIDNADRIFGCKQDVLEPRAMRVSVTKKIAADATSARVSDWGLEHAYGIYKASAMADMINYGFPGDHEKLALLLASQNIN